MTNATATLVFVALVGTNGYVDVVYGLGTGVDYDDALEAARDDALTYDCPDDPETLRDVEIDAATARAIEAGEIDAAALGLA